MSVGIAVGNVAILAKYFPQEKKAMERMKVNESKAYRAQINGTRKNGVNGILKGVFYSSGKLIGKIKKLF